VIFFLIFFYKKIRFPTPKIIAFFPLAVSFVGGNGAGEHINAFGAGQNGKRVQSNMGAKNHGIIMPDANKNATLNQLVGAAFGAAGQRCMALPVSSTGETRKYRGHLTGELVQIYTVGIMNFIRHQPSIFPNH